MPAANAANTIRELFGCALELFWQFQDLSCTRVEDWRNIPA
jgi:hypothetical protein